MWEKRSRHEVNELNSWLEKTTSKRRDKLNIIADILEIAKEGALKTQIMQKANLGFVPLNDYLNLLLKLKLIKKMDNAGKDIYVITEKGLTFLHHRNELANLLKSKGEKAKQDKFRK